MIGKTISHYRIIDKIGEGGMGVVYKAEDITLKRMVAIKVLHAQLTRDSEAKERFIHEARAASALEHHNICNIHEIDETGYGQTFMVMACYEGQSLDEKIRRGPLTIDEAVDITRQISQGLSKAHEKGIVHRDIKPANVFVTNDGVVKILDFGLAKLRGQKKLTKEGTTVGTVAYMSPEQTRGDEVDRRTDIWSLGVMLYEMVTGRLPFKGDYEQAVVYSILNEEPEPMTGLRTGVPMELERMAKKAMVKSPGERYQHASEMLVDLRSLGKASLQRREKASAPRGISKRMMGILAIGILCVAFMAWYLIAIREKAGIHIIRTQPLTTAPGLEQEPTWSPEGTRIAYSSDEGGNMDIWVHQIVAGQKINLTKDYTGYDGKPAWSPDGEWIAFVSQRDGGGIFLIPSMGGTPKRVISLSFAPSLSYIGAIPPICWSPDGTELAYAIAGSLYTITARGGTPVSVPLPPSGLVVGYSEPAWSPDGEHIACTGIFAVGVSTAQIWSVQCEGADPIPVTEGRNFDHNPIWSSDGKHIFFISDRGGSNDVWRVPVDDRGRPTGQAYAVTAGAGVGAIALSRDEKKLAYTKTIERSNIWSIPIVPDRRLTLDDAQPLTSENQYIENLSISPDGEWIAFDSNRSGNTDVWIMRKDGTELRQLTTNVAHDWVGPWSPDGKQISFHSLRRGNRDLYVMPIAGGAVRPLTSHPADDIVQDWSPDGEKILFSSNRSGNMDIWTISSHGGEPQQLTFHEATEWLAFWSPDGKRIVFDSNRTGNSELFLTAAEGGDPVQLTHTMWLDVQPNFWSEDGQTIFARGIGGSANEGINLWAVSVSDGTARSLIDFKGSLKEPLLFTSDGERLYFTLWESVGDLWMAELSMSK